MQAARSYGYVLVSRSPGRAVITTPANHLLSYDVLHVLEFDSERKCMSIIVREKWSSRILLYSKGADSSIFNNLAHPNSGMLFNSDIMTSRGASEMEEDEGGEGEGEEEGREGGEEGEESEGGNKMANKGTRKGGLRRSLTEEHLTLYAREGLRTLCMAKRVSTCTTM